MEITQETVRNIAELAKLELTNDEVTLYAHQLTDILDYFEKLQEVDTSHIEATASVLSITNVLRKDQVGEALLPEKAIKNAPDSAENQFRVSAVLDE